MAYDSWPKGILKYLNKMRNANKMCDVRILVEHDEILLAHSCVLAASSPFFMSILDGELDAEIDLGEFPSEIIKHVFEFIYTGQSSVGMAELDLFHDVAETLQITYLADMVKGILEHRASGMAPMKVEPAGEAPVLDNVAACVGTKDNLSESYVSVEKTPVLNNVTRSVDKIDNLPGSDVSMEKNQNIHSPGKARKRGRPRKKQPCTPTSSAQKQSLSKSKPLPEPITIITVDDYDACDGAETFSNIDATIQVSQCCISCTNYMYLGLGGIQYCKTLYFLCSNLYQVLLC